MPSAPTSELLPDGTLLVPRWTQDRGWQIDHVRPSDSTYSRELAAHQNKRRSNGIGATWYILAALLPIVGLVGFVYQLAKGRVGPAFALLIVSIVATVVGSVILAAL